MEASSEPFWARTEADAIRRGWLSYRDRSADVQRIMRLMYDADSHYSSLAALYVDHSPRHGGGSLRIVVRQPDEVRTAAYRNETGSGEPVHMTHGTPAGVILYAPSAHAYTTVASYRSCRRWSLEDLPLTVGIEAYTSTTIQGSIWDRGTSILARWFPQPAGLITCTFFCTKRIESIVETSFEGRPCWVLRGRQVPTDDTGVDSGVGWRVDGFQLWVDRQTGIVLRLVFMDREDTLGWAELQDVNIDGHGAELSAQQQWLARWTLPEDATLVQSREYMLLGRRPSL